MLPPALLLIFLCFGLLPAASGHTDQLCLDQPYSIGKERGGGDYKNFVIPDASNETLAARCRASCCQDPQCDAWGVTLRTPGNDMSCPNQSTCCWLKRGAAHTEPHACDVNGQHYGCITGLGNPPPPPPVSAQLECDLRQIIFSNAVKLLPALSPRRQSAQRSALFDALRLGSTGCNHSAPLASDDTQMTPHAVEVSVMLQQLKPPSKLVLYVDPLRGQDALVADGSIDLPFQTIGFARAMVLARRAAAQATPAVLPAVVILREGVYYLNTTLALGVDDAHVTWVAYPGHEVTISGGRPLGSLEWSPAKPNGSVLVTTLPSDAPGDFVALYSAESRLVRARFPNGNVETDIRPTNLLPASGRTKWLLPTGPPRTPATWVVQGQSVDSNAQSTAVTPCRNATGVWNDPDGAMSACHSHQLGGWAERFSPPVYEGPHRALCGIYCGGYGDLCSDLPPQPGHRDCRAISPIGVTYDSALRVPMLSPNTAATVHAFDGNHFSTFIWPVQSVENSATYHFGRGGAQAGQAAHECAESYVENDLALLDAPGEWFLDKKSRKLYIWPNTTATAGPADTTGPSDSKEDSRLDLLIAATLEQLITVKGTSTAPVTGLQFINITFAAAAPTFHREYTTLLGGGDYAMHLGASVVFEGVSQVNVTGCVFDRLGGNALLLHGYARDVAITNNEFVRLGASAIVSVGTAQLGDMTAGLHPHGTRVERNFAHEIGLFEKQATFYFNGISTGALVRHNVAFNGPRAAINVNDGAANIQILHNVLFNWVRETGSFASRLPLYFTAHRACAQP